MLTNKPENHNQKCQIQSISKVKGRDDTKHLPFQKRLKIVIRKRMKPNLKRSVKKILNGLIDWWSRINHKTFLPTDQSKPLSTLNLKAGDYVHVRTKEEITNTLDPWSELKGCAFISEMWQYCGTKHKVLKCVERFVDERDYKIKRVHGVVLLEGVICSGTDFYGKCDRSCFLFWREEWLEKI